MNVITYLGIVFVEVTSDLRVLETLPVLVYEDKDYIAAKDYFKEFYGLDIKTSFVDNSDDVCLHIHTTARLSIDLLSKFPITSTVEAIQTDESGGYSCIEIQIPINK